MKLINGQKIDAATVRGILANHAHTCTYEGSMHTDMSADDVEDGDVFTVMLHLGASVQFHLDSRVRCYFSLQNTPSLHDGMLSAVVGMTPTQALQAVALLGGINSTARLVLNAHGLPIHRPNLSKAINQPCGVPEWLADQLYNLVCRHGESCEGWAMDVAGEHHD